MSGNRTIISEETLLALADGDLQGEEAAAIEAAVSQDPALRDALRRLRLSSAGIAQAFDQTLDEPVPERLLAAARAAGSQRVRARGILAPRLGFGGSLPASPPSPSVLAAAIFYSPLPVATSRQPRVRRIPSPPASK